ncbi:transposase domain-containing protein, partial [Burkholderia glumae]
RYLVWLFTRLPLAATADDYADLMPWRMSAGLNR